MFCCFQRLTQNRVYLWCPEVGAGGGAAFSSCMCKYQAAALLHPAESLVWPRSAADEGQKLGLTLNPDDVVLSSGAFICILQQR